MLMTLSNTAGWVVPALITAFIIVCVVMMLVILIQKPKGGGLSGAFGGAGGGGGGGEMSAFGAKTGDVLTWFTVILFLCFLLLAMGLTWTIRAEVQGTATPQQQQQPAGAAPTGQELDPEDAADLLGEEAAEEDEAAEPGEGAAEPAADDEAVDPADVEADLEEMFTDEPGEDFQPLDEDLQPDADEAR